MTGVKSLFFLGLVLMGLAAIHADEQVVGGVSQLEGDPGRTPSLSWTPP